MANELGMPLGVALAAKALESARVQEIFTNGRGVTEIVQPGAYEVRVALMKGLGDGRDMTETGSAYGDTVMPEASKIAIDLDKVWDKNIDLPATLTDATPVELYDSTIRNIGNSVANYYNKCGIKEMTTADNFTALVKGANDTYGGTILKGLAKFEEGDATNDVYRFETENAIIVVSPSVYGELLNQNLVIYKPMAEFDGNTNYKGMFQGSTPLFVAPAGYFQPSTSTKAVSDAILICAANAVAKGMAPARELKVIDNPNGIGTRLQTLYRAGFKVGNAKGVQYFRVEA